MFQPSTLKRIHNLAAGDVIAWKGRFYQVTATSQVSPIRTKVSAAPIYPIDDVLDETLMSDLLVQIYVWQ